MGASNEEEISLKQIAFDLRALLRWKEDETIAREREKQERDRFHQLLDEKRRGTRNMERLHERMSNKSQHLYSHTPTLVTHYEEEDSRLVDNFYQPPSPLRRERREPREPRAIRIDLPHFYGKDDVEAYLNWKMKVEQLFACHQISEERKVPLASKAMLCIGGLPSKEIGESIKVPRSNIGMTSKEPLGEDIFPPTIIEN